MNDKKPDLKEATITHTTVYMNGKEKDVIVEKDAYGNVVTTIITDKIFGIL